MQRIVAVGVFSFVYQSTTDKLGHFEACTENRFYMEIKKPLIFFNLM
jgi:hypothetical protein